MTMTDSRPRPPAFWADARFLLGIVLVIGSIAAVWAVVATARQTAPALVATRTVVAGQVLSAADLEAVDIGLGAVAERYLAPGELVPGSVATRTLPRGDLIPRDAVGPAETARVTTIVLRSSGEVPAAVSTGSEVEVWSASPREQGRFDAPAVLVPLATVVSVNRGDAVMGGGETTVEVVIDRADLADALAAIAEGAALSVVPATGTAP